MRRLAITLLITALAVPVFAADAPKTEEQKTLYAVGLIVARQLSAFSLSPQELEIVKQGIDDAATGKTLQVDLASYSDKVQELAKARRKIEGEKLAGINKAFIEKAASVPGAVKTPSGLVYLSLLEGTGAIPGPTDTVKVNYRGTLPDGKEFDSSYRRGKPTDLRMDGVIKCLKEGLPMMKVGGKARLTCPSPIAYGEEGVGPLVLPGATLAFEVELIEIKK
jgi:FKBP-type peptidyl-prolyl cis-trans isomerase FkpA